MTTLTDDDCRRIYNEAMELPNRSAVSVTRYILSANEAKQAGDAVATMPNGKFADPFTYIIQHLNSSPYNMTKDECIEYVRTLRDSYKIPPTEVSGVVAKYAEDAARYRWLRDQTQTDGIAIVMKNKHIDDSADYPANINRFIDAALGKA